MELTNKDVKCRIDFRIFFFFESEVEERIMYIAYSPANNTKNVNRRTLF